MAGAARASRPQGGGPLQLQLPMQQPAGLGGPSTVRRARTRLVRTPTHLAPSLGVAGRSTGFHVGAADRDAARDTLGALSRGARRTAVKVGIVGLDPVRDEIERLTGFLEGSLVG